MEHLTCFAGGTQGTVPILESLCLRHCFARVGFAAALTGMFALGSVMFTHDSNQLHVGKELTKTCYQMCAHSTGNKSDPTVHSYAQLSSQEKSSQQSSHAAPYR